MERIPTGIKGFDDLIGGGFVPYSAVMVGGKAGTGKTLFCTQFLYTGATKHGEPGLYVTLGESVEDLRGDVITTFGWNIEELERNGLLIWLPLIVKKVFHPVHKREVLTMGLYQITQFILKAVEDSNAKRVIIDPISAIEMMFEDQYMVRSEIITLLGELKRRGVTTLFVAEVPEPGEGLSRSEFLEFLTDAVIKLDYIYLAKKYQRSITIKKMRRSDHSHFIHPFVITPEGIEVLKV